MAGRGPRRMQDRLRSITVTLPLAGVGIAGAAGEPPAPTADHPPSRGARVARVPPTSPCGAGTGWCRSTGPNPLLRR
jgi:hypothetical protein